MIICKDLSIGYNSNLITKDINIQINKGEYISIIGENGAGKSTLLKTMLGIVKPLVGEVIIDKNNIRLGYLSQETESQKDFPASVEEVVYSGLQNSKQFFGRYKKEDKIKAINNMENLGILELKNKCFRDLSGGQKQKVLLARAICSTKDYLFLDEPISGLDKKSSEDFYNAIDLMHKQNITIIMVTHDLKMALEKSSRIIHVSKKILYDGECSSYIESNIGKAYLEAFKEEE